MLQGRHACGVDLLLLLHGLASSGAHMVHLGVDWAQRIGVPHVASPDAPEKSDTSVYGHQWFSLQGVTEETWKDRVAAAEAAFDAVVDREVARVGTTLRKTVLVGHSQGAIMALDALVRGRRFAGVVAFSGRLVRQPTSPIAGDVPVLLVHGEADGRVPAEDAITTHRVLRAAGATSCLKIIAGQGHSIGEAGAAAGAGFLAGLATKEMRAGGRDEGSRRRGAGCPAASVPRSSVDRPGA